MLVLREEVGLERSNLTLFEQVLAIHMVDADRRVRYTNLFTQRCAHMQRILLSTYVHAAVLDGFDGEYQLPAVKLGPKKLTDRNNPEEQEEQKDHDGLDGSPERPEDVCPDAHPQGIDKEVDEEMAALAAQDANNSATSRALFHLSSLGENVNSTQSAVTVDGLLADLDDDDLLDDGQDEGIFADAKIVAGTKVLKYVNCSRKVLL